MGITTYEKNSDKEFLAKPYNFFVFPEENSGNPNINWELGAIIFNREHKMDFNKWINKGIPYMNSKQEKRELEYINDSNINLYNPEGNNRKTINLFREDDKKKYENFQSEFNDFLFSDANCNIFDKYPKFMQYHIMNNIEENIRNKLYFSEEKIDKKDCFVINKVSKEERQKKIEKDLEKRKEELNRAKGFKNIFDAIVKNRKIVIGHNCIVDLNFVISHFGDNLPGQYCDWKKMLMNYFGK